MIGKMSSCVVNTLSSWRPKDWCCVAPDQQAPIHILLNVLLWNDMGDMEFSLLLASAVRR